MKITWRNAKSRPYHWLWIWEVFHGSQTGPRNQANLVPAMCARVLICVLTGVLFGLVCSVQRRLQPVPGLLSQPPPIPRRAVWRSHPRERHQSQVRLNFQIFVLWEKLLKWVLCSNYFALRIKGRVIQEADVFLFNGHRISFDICTSFYTNYQTYFYHVLG